MQTEFGAPVSIAIWNIEGRVQHQSIHFLEPGTNRLQLPLGLLSQGNYWMTVEGPEEEPITLQFIKTD